MKSLKNIMVMLFFILMFSTKCFAVNLEETTKDYYSLKEKLSQTTNTGAMRLKTISSVVVDTVGVDQQRGLVLLATDFAGPISIENIRSISTPLYENTELGLYSYKSLKVLVWYVGNSASVISIMTKI